MEELAGGLADHNNCPCWGHLVSHPYKARASKSDGYGHIYHQLNPSYGRHIFQHGPYLAYCKTEIYLMCMTRDISVLHYAIYIMVVHDTFYNGNLIYWLTGSWEISTK